MTIQITYDYTVSGDIYPTIDSIMSAISVWHKANNDLKPTSIKMSFNDYCAFLRAFSNCFTSVGFDNYITTPYGLIKLLIGSVDGIITVENDSYVDEQFEKLVLEKTTT